MTTVLATATFEEFLDSFRVLWCVRVLVFVLLLAAVIRMMKDRRIGGAKLLMVGLAWLVIGGLMECATRYGWVELGYSPSYASMRAEWEMGDPDWARWEPVFWWTRFVVGFLGLIAAGVGFVLCGRRMAEKALRRDLAGGEPEPEQ